MIYPLPEKLLKDFAAKVDKVIVIEELDPIIENHCLQLGINVSGKDKFPIVGEFSQGLIRACMKMDVIHWKIQFLTDHQSCVRDVLTVESFIH